jgi:membrane-associated protein
MLSSVRFGCVASVLADSSGMDWIRLGIDVVLHLDKYLNGWAEQLGALTYVLLGATIFVETGLVVFPFLPGDSLLFAVGALSATDGSPVSIWLVALLLPICAILGDTVNYTIGRRVGPRIFASDSSKLFNRKHLDAAQRFYYRHGRKTIIIARFVPIIRTFAPFVAGIGKMSYARFISFSIVGGLLWIWSLLLLGYYFGGLPVVKRNFSIVILMVIAISLLPMVIEFIKAKREARHGIDPLLNATTVGEEPDGK